MSDFQRGERIEGECILPRAKAGMPLVGSYVHELGAKGEALAIKLADGRHAVVVASTAKREAVEESPIAAKLREIALVFDRHPELSRWLGADQLDGHKFGRHLRGDDVLLINEFAAHFAVPIERGEPSSLSGNRYTTVEVVVDGVACKLQAHTDEYDLAMTESGVDK